MNQVILYCIVLYCIVLYCIVLYCVIFNFRLTINGQVVCVSRPERKVETHMQNNRQNNLPRSRSARMHESKYRECLDVCLDIRITLTSGTDLGDQFILHLNHGKTIPSEYEVLT